MDEVISYVGQPRDRRQRRRYMTRRNVLIALAVVVSVFVIVSIASEFRAPGSGHGRLYMKRTKIIETAPHQKPVPTIVEAPVPSNARGFDPMSVDAARREQYLGVPTSTAISNENILSAPIPGSDVMVPTDLPTSAPLSGGFMRDGEVAPVPSEPAMSIPAPAKVEGGESKVIITHGADGVVLLKKE